MSGPVFLPWPFPVLQANWNAAAKCYRGKSYARKHHIIENNPRHSKTPAAAFLRLLRLLRLLSFTPHFRAACDATNHESQPLPPHESPITTHQSRLF